MNTKGRTEEEKKKKERNEAEIGQTDGRHPVLGGCL